MCKQWTAVFSFVASVFSVVSAFSPSQALAVDHYTHYCDDGGRARFGGRIS